MAPPPVQTPPLWINGGGAMPESAKVFEDRAIPGEWRVEWFDDDGRCELEIFRGPTARRDALRYAMRTYGHFRETQLEPNSPR